MDRLLVLVQGFSSWFKFNVQAVQLTNPSNTCILAMKRISTYKVSNSEKVKDIDQPHCRYYLLTAERYRLTAVKSAATS